MANERLYEENHAKLLLILFMHGSLDPWQQTKKRTKQLSLFEYMQ